MANVSFVMDLGQLRSFAEVAERGTVAAAAEALGFTAPAVSQHISKLEKELKVALFVRAGRRLKLSDSGRALVPVALQMIDLDLLGHQVVTRQVSRPHYTVAGFASALDALVTPRLSAIRKEMSLNVVEMEDADALRDLRLGVVDLVLTQEYQGLPAERDPRLAFVPLISDKLRLVLPAKFAASTTIDLLGDEPWLMNGHGTRCTEATMGILRAKNLQPQIAATVADNNSLLALVAAGHGVTVIPDLVLGTQRKGVTVAAQDLGVTRTILAVHRVAGASAVAPLVGALTD